MTYVISKHSNVTCSIKECLEDRTAENLSYSLTKKHHPFTADIFQLIYFILLSLGKIKTKPTIKQKIHQKQSQGNQQFWATLKAHMESSVPGLSHWRKKIPLMSFPIRLYRFFVLNHNHPKDMQWIAYP